MRNAATQTGHTQPTDGEVREAHNLFWSTHKRPLPPGQLRGKQAHHQPPEQVEYVPGAPVPAVLLVAPDGLKTTMQPGTAHGSLWMLQPPTARPFCPPPLSQDKLTGTPTTCRRCGPQALATPWPLHQLLARYHHIPTSQLPRNNTGGYTRTSNGPRRRTRPQWRGTPAQRRNGDSDGERGTPSSQPSPSWCWPNTTAPHRRPQPTRFNTAAPKSRTFRRSSGPHSTNRKRTCSNMCTAISHKATRGTRLCPHEPSSNREDPPGAGRGCYPKTPTGHHHAVGHHKTVSTCPRLPANDAVPPAVPRRP